MSTKAMGTVYIKISDTEEIEAEFESFVIFPTFPITYFGTCQTPTLVPHNDGRFQIVVSPCLFFPQYKAICTLDTPFYVKSKSRKQYKVGTGILKLRYKGKPGHPSNHEELINDYDYTTLYVKEVVDSIYHPSSNQYDYQNELYVCILDVQKQQKINFGIDGDDAVEYEIINLNNSNERIVKGDYGSHGFRGSPHAISTVTLEPGRYLVIVRQEEDYGGEGVIFYWKYQDESNWRVFSINDAPGKVYSWIPDDNEIQTKEFIVSANVDLNDPLFVFEDRVYTVSRYTHEVHIDGISFRPFFTNLPSIFNEQIEAKRKTALLIYDSLENKVLGYFVLTNDL